jgi:uncharacterized protein
MQKMITQFRQTGVPVIIGAGGLLSMTLIAYLLQKERLPLWVISEHEMVNFTFTMQAMVLLLSFMALAFIYLYDRKGFRTFFRFSPFASHPENNWKFYGPATLISFTLGTMLLMSASVIPQNGSMNESFFAMLPLVLLFSATNAWSEEIFGRFVIVVGLHGKINPVTICWISAIIFGLPHFFGTPSGVFGVIMSGLLGWLLAKSVIETKALGWALLIHFLQDVIIFGAGAMIIAAQQ